MGFPKKLIYKTINSTRQQSFTKGRRLKKTLIGALAVGVVLFAGFTALVFLFISWGANALSARPDVDLMAMEQLVASNKIVISADQKEKLAPVLEELTGGDLSPERQAALKDQLWRALGADQVKEIEQQKEEISKKASGLFAIPPGLAALVEKYTGITPAMIKDKIDVLLTW